MAFSIFWSASRCLWRAFSLEPYGTLLALGLLSSQGRLSPCLRSFVFQQLGALHPMLVER